MTFDLWLARLRAAGAVLRGVPTVANADVMTERFASSITFGFRVHESQQVHVLKVSPRVLP